MSGRLTVLNLPGKIEPRIMKQLLKRLGLLVLPFLVLIGIIWLFASRSWSPLTQDELFTHTVYAYRQWQSTGFYLNPGDKVIVRASGDWMYSPEVGRSSAYGGEPAPGYYPLPSARGGALIGKIGETGQAFLVGNEFESYVQEAGLLYLRINDDKLGDNQGELGLSIQIIAPTATANP